MSNRPRRHGNKSPRPPQAAVAEPAPEPPVPAPWNDTGLLELVQAILANPHFWPEDSRCKYLDLRIDTRDGGFVLRDRDHKPLTPADVHAAIAAHKARWSRDGEI